MEKRAVLAIVLSLLVIVLWTYVFAPQTPVDVPPVEQRKTPAPTSSLPLPAPVVTPPAPTSQATPVTVDTGVARLTLTGQGAGIKKVELLAYRATLAKDSPPVTITPIPDAPVPSLEARLQFNGEWSERTGNYRQLN